VDGSSESLLAGAVAVGGEESTLRAVVEWIFQRRLLEFGAGSQVMTQSYACMERHHDGKDVLFVMAHFRDGGHQGGSIVHT